MSQRYVAEVFRAVIACALVGMAAACSCISAPPLSDCSVPAGEAALLVKVQCRKTIQCGRFSGTGVSDVQIKLVLRDSTDLNLAEGSVVSVEAPLDGNFCGYSLEADYEYIVFVRQTTPVEGNNATASPTVERVTTMADDDVVCHTFDAPLSTSLCSGNVRSPSDAQIAELITGCVL